MYNILECINDTGDIKKIDPGDYSELAQEIRSFLIDKISVTGGHLASNLGDVELTMALHIALDLPDDKIVWDVGHQSYTHKLLTGRKNDFDTLRKLGGMSGFPKRAESDCDAFDTGHSSTSISAGLGLVKARDLQGKKNTVVSVIGDGAMTGGLAYEALNNASKLDTNFIIILNDNNMSISENVGGFPNYLNDIRTSSTYIDVRNKVYDSLSGKAPSIARGIQIAKKSLKTLVVPGMFFEEMGITYLGPVDGHNIIEILRTLEDAKRVNKAVLIHVLTEKGKGYGPAEKHPARFHGTGPFDKETGLPVNPVRKAGYTDIFSTVMIKLAARNPSVVGITAAMSDGVGLKRFRNIYPERFFDVGIAEQHAVTFAAGLAAGGMRPVVAVYSTFLQRAYDQIAVDVCLQNLPVIFAVDRAGLVGADGETHQGIFDLSYLAQMPNMTVMAPKNKWELSDMLKFALKLGTPAAIRYPRGEAYAGLKEFRSPMALGKSEMIFREKDIALVAVGSMVKTGEKVREILHEKGMSCTLVNARFVKPLDTEMLDSLCPDHKMIVTMEENITSGGFGEHVQAYMDSCHRDIRTIGISIQGMFVRAGSPDQLAAELGIDAESIAARIVAGAKKSGSLTD